MYPFETTWILILLVLLSKFSPVGRIDRGFLWNLCLRIVTIHGQIAARELLGDNCELSSCLVYISRDPGLEIQVVTFNTSPC
ncbi:hypothetical protein DFH27DRAFT_561925 [Peziza echinospora]|nr:hypothetical protein DFH27DRAFT_561925 [Peziza echinospora]